MFYFCFPLICRTLGRDKVIVSLLLIFVVLGPIGRSVLSHGNPVWHEYSYLGSMDAIALGCLTAMLSSRYRLPRRLLRVCGICGAALLATVLGFSTSIDRWGLGRSGLDMTVVAFAACLLLAAAAQSEWRSPRALRPLLLPGRRSYEIYLTHMFIVLAFFGYFIRIGRPLDVVPMLFVAVILAAIVLGELVGRVVSEPLNRLLRSAFRGVGQRVPAVADAR